MAFSPLNGECDVGDRDTQDMEFCACRERHGQAETDEAARVRKSDRQGIAAGQKMTGLETYRKAQDNSTGQYLQYCADAMPE